MIRSINFAILTFFKIFVQFSQKNFRVETYEHLFIFFLEGNKNCRVSTKKQDRSG